jgi:epsin
VSFSKFELFSSWILFFFLSASPTGNSNNPFPTMSDPTPYAVGLQPQYTQIQPQFTSFNPYQQQMQQEAAQQAYLEQQQLFMMQQQQAQAQQEAMMQQQQQEEWMRQQMMQQQFQQQQQLQQQQQQPQFSLAPQPTGFGSNNPFAPSTQASPPPQNNNLGPPSFNLQGTYQNHDDRYVNDLSKSSLSPSPQPVPQQQPSPQGNRPVQVRPKKDENEQLANLFANRDDGMDTFGNTGNLRYVIFACLVWCGRPDLWVFLISYGHTNAGRMVVQQTGTPGHNPFAMQQQQQQAQQNPDQPFFSI